MDPYLGGTTGDNSVGHECRYVVIPDRMGLTTSVTIAFVHGRSSVSQKGGDDTDN